MHRKYFYRIKRLGRDDLNYQANPFKVHQLKGTKTSFPFLTSITNCKMASIFIEEPLRPK